MAAISTFQIVREKNEIHLTYASGKKEVLSFNTTEKIREYVKELLEKTSAKFVFSPFYYYSLEKKREVKIHFSKLEDCENFRDFIALEIFKGAKVTSTEGQDLFVTFPSKKLLEIEEEIAVLRRAPPARLWPVHVHG